MTVLGVFPAEDGVVEEEVAQGGAEDDTAEQEDGGVGVADPPRAETRAGGCGGRVMMA